MNIQLWMDFGEGSEFVPVLGLDSPNLRTVITLSQPDYPIMEGRYFRFKYRCQNKNGFSEYSDITYVLAASVPSKPAAPQLISATSAGIELKFFKPKDDNGSEVILYELYINDGTNTEPTTLVTAYSDNQMSFMVDAI
jgi:hypothetical protein